MDRPRIGCEEITLPMSLMLDAASVSREGRIALGENEIINLHFLIADPQSGKSKILIILENLNTFFVYETKLIHAQTRI